MKELHLAQGIALKDALRDFVIPLHLDNLPHNETTIGLPALTRSSHPALAQFASDHGGRGVQTVTPHLFVVYFIWNERAAEIVEAWGIIGHD